MDLNLPVMDVGRNGDPEPWQPPAQDGCHVGADISHQAYAPPHAGNHSSSTLSYECQPHFSSPSSFSHDPSRLDATPDFSLSPYQDELLLERAPSTSISLPLPASHSLNLQSFESCSIPDSSSSQNWYELLISQQPSAVKASPESLNERIMMSPPPKVQLSVTNCKTGRADHKELKNPYNIVYCELWNSDGITQPHHHVFSAGSPSKDAHGAYSFPELSCRTPGRYQLRFCVMRMDPTKVKPGYCMPALAATFSDVFTVHPEELSHSSALQTLWRRNESNRSTCWQGTHEPQSAGCVGGIGTMHHASTCTPAELITGETNYSNSVLEFDHNRALRGCGVDQRLSSFAVTAPGLETEPQLSADQQMMIGDACASTSFDTDEFPSVLRQPRRDLEENREDGRGEFNASATDRTSTRSYKFACPFFKRWAKAKNNSCVHPGFSDIPRLKEHLYRTHGANNRCQICYEVFPDINVLDQHMRAADRCIVRQRPFQDELLTFKEERKLKNKKEGRMAPGEEKWRHIYNILFPDVDKIPSPYVERCSSDRDQEIEGLKQHLQRALVPSLLRGVQAFVEKDARLAVLEQLQGPLIEVVRKSISITFGDYARACSTPLPEPSTRSHHEEAAPCSQHEPDFQPEI